MRSASTLPFAGHVPLVLPAVEVQVRAVVEALCDVTNVPVIVCPGTIPPHSQKWTMRVSKTRTIIPPPMLKRKTRTCRPWYSARRPSSR